MARNSLGLTLSLRYHLTKSSLICRRAVYFALRHPHLSRKGPSPQKLDFMSASLFLVGVTSLIYHATLRQTPQFLDDLSMFMLAASLIQPIFTVNQTRRVRYAITTILASSISVLSVMYVRSGNVLFHTYAFAALLHLIWPRTLYLIYAQRRSEQEKTRLIRRFAKAVVILVVAFMLWNLDLEKCLELRKFRKKLGLPWAWLLEFHGWWHILTAVGASEYIELVRDLCGN